MRIFTVVDVWDVLVSDRPYRKRWEGDKVRSYLRDNAGIIFDTEVVTTFLEILDAEESASIALPFATSHVPSVNGEVHSTSLSTLEDVSDELSTSLCAPVNPVNPVGSHHLMPSLEA